MQTPAIGTLVGRTAQTDRIAGLLDELAAGKGGSVLVEGGQGMGKSALLSWAAARAAARGCRLIRMAATEIGQRFPLRSVREALDRGSLSLPAAPGAQAATAGAERSPLLIVEQIIGAIGGAAAQGPVAVLLDDVHWADDATLLLWHRLTRTTARLPVLLIASVRTGAADGVRHALTDRGATVLVLPPLTTEDVAALVAAESGAEPARELSERLDAAEGNPLYVREMLDALWRSGGIFVARERARLTDEARGDGARPPLRAVAHRFGALRPDTVEVLRRAALLGTEFTATDLAAVTGRSVFALLGAVEDAITAGVLVDTGELLRFGHALFRATLYDGTPEAERTTLHREAARALYAADAALERVAEQLMLTGGELDDWVVDWLAVHGERLGYRSADVCVELLRRAIDQVPSDDSRCPGLEDRLAAVAYMLRRPESHRILRGLLARTTDAERRSRCAAWLVGGMFWEGTWDEALAVLDEEERRVGDRHSAWGQRFQALRALALQGAGRHELTAEAAARVFVLPDRVRDPGAEAYARHATGQLLQRRRRTEEAVAEWDRGIEIGRELARTAPGEHQYLDVLTSMLIYRALALGTLDRLDEAVGTLREAREIALAEGAEAQLGNIAISSAVLNFWTGDWDEALSDLDTLDVVSGVAWLPVLLHGISALVHGYRGNGEEARAHGAHLRDLPDPEGIQRAHSSYRIMAGALAAERADRPREALAVLLPTLSPEYARELDQRYQWLPDVVRLALQTGDGGTARAATAVAVAEADGGAHRGRTASALRCRGLVERDARLTATAAEHYRQAGRTFQTGQALEDTAAVLASLGDAKEARRRLGEAVECYRRARAEWAVTRAHARLKALGVRPAVVRGGAAGQQRTGWGALTPAELKVALLVARGRSNPQIAGELYLSPRTVQTHVSHILGKLGVRSRAEVAREAAGYLNSS
ncbi:AAA family ATPase [Streptomyces sp. NPDC001941]|uniref:helix-turn-helix transcriptional regulator n=1 Tax=Streptomyces sp. NPDC001941 TaxID=3154659 RepID=UPI00332F4FB6